MLKVDFKTLVQVSWRTRREVVDPGPGSPPEGLASLLDILLRQCKASVPSCILAVSQDGTRQINNFRLEGEGLSGHASVGLLARIC